MTFRSEEVREWTKQGVGWAMSAALLLWIGTYIVIPLRDSLLTTHSSLVETNKRNAETNSVNAETLKNNADTMAKQTMLQEKNTAIQERTASAMETFGASQRDIMNALKERSGRQ